MIVTIDASVLEALCRFADIGERYVLAVEAAIDGREIGIVSDTLADTVRWNKLLLPIRSAA
jgi:hypothetical protein